MYLLFRSEVSYVCLPVASGISSSFCSVSVSDFLRFCTNFSFPLSISRSISSQRPYFPSSPHRQCLFFGWISLLVRGSCSRLVFFLVWNSGPEINFRLIIFPVSVLTVLSVLLIAICILFWNFFLGISCYGFFFKFERIANRIFLFRWFWTFHFVRAITMSFVSLQSASRPT